MLFHHLTDALIWRALLDCREQNIPVTVFASDFYPSHRITVKPLKHSYHFTGREPQHGQLSVHPGTGQKLFTPEQIFYCDLSY